MPRWIGKSPDSATEIHVFTDAFEKAYGAVIYLRSINKNGSVSTAILTSKSRVAPLKTQSIPRLELFEALLGARLVKYVQTACNLTGVRVRVYCWADSSIVIGWIQKEPANLTSFIATRVTEILSVTERQSWNYVKGVENPADILSRGATASQLAKGDFWWFGPSWLKKSSTDWPSYVPPELTPEEQQAVLKDMKRNVSGIGKSKISKLVLLSAAEETGLPSGAPCDDQLSVKNNHGAFESLVLRRSTYNGVLRVTAYVIRFIERIRTRLNQPDRARLILGSLAEPAAPLTPPELDKALGFWLRAMQKNSFSKEIEACNSWE